MSNSSNASNSSGVSNITVSQCAKCQKDFTCGLKANAGSCWCHDMPPLAPIPKEYKDCLCQDCLKNFALKEGEDFYYENGNMVFTEKYHLKRGVCCGSGCRHCPY